mmetsp:Transcript_6776/g.9149  ORF Transcript_6776/g.9149 Transcript_6776/m.9149 type:complete len:441 (-) Transcript_6776:36-1358(-)
MGCTSSTEAAPVGASKGIAKDEHDVKRREKSPTAGTEAMATNHEADPADPTSKTNIGAVASSKAPTEIPAHGDWSTTASNASTITIGNWSLRYACISKKGRDPDDKAKPNQDRYRVHKSFAGNSNAAFFGMYNGHRSHGNGCAKYIQEQLPKLAQDHIEHQQFGDMSVSIDQIRASLHMAHTEVNDELRLSKINDSYSGTTAITLHIHESRITVCNVGDSRAILGTKKAGMDNLVSVPLSKDQTPHRPDEAARCKRSGARILSFGQINGDADPEVEDPPRVWAKNGHYPGTAFTRSIGDAVAEKLGVFAEPEMLTVKISQNEKLLVLASDGIFDVMSNQDVIDLCFQHKEDPLTACNAVIEKSHEEWLLNEDCTNEESASYDDMTIVCVFVDEAMEVPSGFMNSSDTDTQLPAPTPGKKQHHGKRVRQKTLRNLEEMQEG